MDPNAALIAIRKALADLDHAPSATAAEFEDSARRMADYFEALDGWLAHGGFLPDAWQAARPAPRS